MTQRETIVALTAALKGMVANFRPFTMKPIGAEGSQARIEQQQQIDAYRLATETLAKAEGRA